MGLFDDIWSTIKHTGEDVFNSVKDVASNGCSDVFRPISKGVGETGNKLINTGANFVDKQAQNAENLTTGLTNLVTNPITWIGELVVAIIVLPKVLEK